VSAINDDRENTVFLKGHRVPPLVSASGDLGKVVTEAELVLLVIPTQFAAGALKAAAPFLDPKKHILLSCTKGIEISSLETCDEIFARVLPAEVAERAAFLSGPSFAAEVAAGQPTMVTVASRQVDVARRCQALLSDGHLRVYSSIDVPGVEIGGALKNVLAIACGVSDGLGFGANARAALMVRGLSEITRLAVARGADPLTMQGLAGMGDLVLTCTGELSRNRTVGLRLGKGETLAEIQASVNTVAEGVATSIAAEALARKLGVDCPIIAGIHSVIHGGADARKVVGAAMGRPLRDEVAPEVIEAAGRSAV